MLDRIHYNGKGHALVAGLLAAFLRSQSPGDYHSAGDHRPAGSIAEGPLPAGSLQARSPRLVPNGTAVGEVGDVALPPPLYFAQGSSFALDKVRVELS